MAPESSQFSSTPPQVPAQAPTNPGLDDRWEVALLWVSLQPLPHPWHPFLTRSQSGTFYRQMGTYHHHFLNFCKDLPTHNHSWEKAPTPLDSSCFSLCFSFMHRAPASLALFPSQITLCPSHHRAFACAGPSAWNAF